MGNTLRGTQPAPKDNNDLYIQILKNTLKQSDIPDEFCSVGEYAEEGILPVGLYTKAKEEKNIISRLI